MGRIVQHMVGENNKVKQVVDQADQHVFAQPKSCRAIVEFGGTRSTFIRARKITRDNNI